MTIPLQVKRAAEAADELQKQLVSGETPEQPAAETPAGEEQAPVTAEQQFTREPAAAEAPAPEGQPSGGPEDWEEKYRTLSGKYSSEVPKLHRQLKELQDKLDHMRDLFAQLQTQPPPAPAPDSDRRAAPKPTTVISDEEREDYGEDLLDVMGRAGKQAVTPEIEALRAEIAALKQQLGGVTQHVAKSAREEMFDTLTKEVPNWAQINESQQFLDWLGQLDPYSGYRRQDMLDHASANNDAARIVNFFRGFLRESNAVAPTSQTGSPQRGAKRNLEEMVTPGAGRSGTVSAPQGNESTWSQREIAQFYRDVNQGKYKNDPKQKDAIERQILKASTEGRVTV